METIQEMLKRRIIVAQSDVKQAQQNKTSRMMVLESHLDSEISYYEGRLKELETISDLDWVDLANTTLNRLSTEPPRTG